MTFAPPKNAQRRLLRYLAVLMMTAPVISCARKTDTDAERAGVRGACTCAETSSPVAAPVLAWLSKARSLHHAADLAEDAGQIERAVDALEELLRGPRPPAASPEIDEVSSDTRARLADLRSRKGDFAAALSDIAQGLRVARDATYFRGHLFEVEGLVHERQARAFGQEGNQTEAERARSEAIRASIEAVRIQDEVIRNALGDAGAATKGVP